MRNNFLSGKLNISTQPHEEQKTETLKRKLKEDMQETPTSHHKLLCLLDFLPCSCISSKAKIAKCMHSLATVSQLPELLHCHGFFLDVVLSEES